MSSRCSGSSIFIISRVSDLDCFLDTFCVHVSFHFVSGVPSGSSMDSRCGLFRLPLTPFGAHQGPCSSLGRVWLQLLPGLQPLGSFFGVRRLSLELVFGVRMAPFHSFCILMHCTTSQLCFACHLDSFRIDSGVSPHSWLSWKLRGIVAEEARAARSAAPNF